MIKESCGSEFHLEQKKNYDKNTHICNSTSVIHWISSKPPIVTEQGWIVSLWYNHQNHVLSTKHTPSVHNRPIRIVKGIVNYRYHWQWWYCPSHAIIIVGVYKQSITIWTCLGKHRGRNYTGYQPDRIRYTRHCIL